MEIQTIKISEEDRKLLSDFYGEDLGNEIDFNRLMPVVEKIESLGYATKFRYEAFTSGPENAYHDIEIFSLNENNGYKRVACCMDRIPKIKAVYKAVVEFIKWYNQNK